jgi:hypothetical protein
MYIFQVTSGHVIKGPLTEIVVGLSETIIHILSFIIVLKIIA